jgi:hypothetical protein
VHYSAEYMAARTVLLDALEALNSHLPNIVLVGAQAVYLHTGAGDLAQPPMTTDADLALDTSALAHEPEITGTLMNAGSAPERIRAAGSAEAKSPWTSWLFRGNPAP